MAIKSSAKSSGKSATRPSVKSSAGTSRSRAKRKTVKRVSSKPAAKKFASRPVKKTAAKAGKAFAHNKKVSGGKKVRTLKSRKPVARKKALQKPVAKKKMAVAARPKTEAAKSIVKAPPKSPLLQLVEAALADMKAVNVAVLDVRGLTDVADDMVIASGNSDRHVRSIADHVVQAAKKAGFRPMGVEGERDGEWALVDLQDIVVHVMLPRVREFYRLENLWDISAARRESALTPA